MLCDGHEEGVCLGRGRVDWAEDSAVLVLQFEEDDSVSGHGGDEGEEETPLDGKGSPDGDAPSLLTLNLAGETDDDEATLLVGGDECENDVEDAARLLVGLHADENDGHEVDDGGEDLESGPDGEKVGGGSFVRRGVWCDTEDHFGGGDEVDGDAKDGHTHGETAEDEGVEEGGEGFASLGDGEELLVVEDHVVSLQ